MINVKYRGRLGNNLFQYCIGRILSESINTNLNFINNSKQIRFFKNAVDIKTFSEPKKEVITLTDRNYDSTKVSCEFSYMLDGHFETYEYFREHKSKIKEWLFLPELPLPYTINSNDSVICLRLTDMKRYIGEKNYTYIDKMIDQFPPPSDGKLYIVTDNPSDPIFQDVSDRYKAIHHKTDFITDFSIIKNFKRIYLAPSTFAWWAAWLSEARFICYPEVGIWRRKSLFVYDEDRYVKVKL